MKRATRTPIPWRLHAFVRLARSVLLRIASPLDRTALLLNGKGDLPPIQLRRQSGPLQAFERAAAEYVGLLSAMAGLQPSSRILDVGCGAGAMAIMLRDRVPPEGRYLGFDVDEACVRWCQGHLRDARFEFAHHDYWNATYRPGGRRFKAWPVPTNGADIVILKSLFTHMLPPDVEFYVAELERVLAPGGTGLVTAFTYTSVDRPVEAWFQHDGDGFRYARTGAPESAVAYPRDWLLGVFRDHDLALDFHPGFWRPQDGPTLAYQDVIMVRHWADRSIEPAPPH
jgi:SAM-dependent methyltransferase